jgi:hypothetical protein
LESATASVSAKFKIYNSKFIIPAQLGSAVFNYQEYILFLVVTLSLKNLDVFMKLKFSIISIGFLLWFVLGSCSEKDKFTRAFKVISHKSLLLLPSAEIDRGRKTKFADMFDDDAYIRFYDNGQYTSLNKKGNYYTGQWQLIEGEGLVLQLKIDNVGTVLFNVKDDKDEETGAKYLSLKSKDFGQIEVSLVLKEDDFYQNGDVDLLSSTMNWWRERPENVENQEQIKKRVLAQLEYMIQYFKMVNDKNLDSFYATHLQSSIEFYSNGISLNNDLERLTEYYYDEEAALKAQQYLEDGFNSLSKYPADPQSFTKGYYNALKEISKAISLM